MSYDETMVTTIHDMLKAQGKPVWRPHMLPNPESSAISSHLPDMVDQYITIRAQRLALAKEVEEKEELEKELYRTIIAKMRDQEMTAIGGKMGLVKLGEDIEPVGEDWPKIWAHIQATGDFDLLHKRLTVTAVKERWEDGQEIPGVGRVPKYKLTVSKTK